MIGFMVMTVYIRTRQNRRQWDSEVREDVITSVMIGYSMGIMKNKIIGESQRDTISVLVLRQSNSMHLPP